MTGRNLAQHFRTVDALLQASPEEIQETPGVGPKMAVTIHDQLHDPLMESLIADLREQGLRFEEEGPPPGEGPLVTPPDVTELVLEPGHPGEHDAAYLRRRQPGSLRQRLATHVSA